MLHAQYLLAPLLESRQTLYSECPLLCFEVAKLGTVDASRGLMFCIDYQIKTSIAWLLLNLELGLPLANRFSLWIFRSCCQRSRSTADICQKCCSLNILLPFAWWLPKFLHWLTSERSLFVLLFFITRSSSNYWSSY